MGLMTSRYGIVRKRKAYSRDLYLFFRRNYMLCNDDNDIRKMVSTARCLVWGAAVGIGRGGSNGGGGFDVSFFSFYSTHYIPSDSVSVLAQLRCKRHQPFVVGSFLLFFQFLFFFVFGKRWVFDGIHDNAPYNYKPMANIDIMFYLDVLANIFVQCENNNKNKMNGECLQLLFKWRNKTTMEFFSYFHERFFRLRSFGISKCVGGVDDIFRWQFELF